MIISTSIGDDDDDGDDDEVSPWFDDFGPPKSIRHGPTTVICDSHPANLD